MTIGKKIALGFGALILIAGVQGTLSIIITKKVQAQAQTLADGYVPETRIADEIGDTFGQAVLALRSYGFTAEPSYLEEFSKAMVGVHTAQQAAQKLSDAHPELVKLRDDLTRLDPAIEAYENLAAQTEAKTKEIIAGRAKLNQAAAGFITNIDKLIADQKTKLENEIKTFAEAPKLQQRADKLELANLIRGLGNMARIIAFKSQALRDPALMEEGLAIFSSMDKHFDELQAMLSSQPDIDELMKVKSDAHAYRDAMKQTMDDNVVLAEVGKKRLEAMANLNQIVHDTQKTGMERTVEAANISKQSLASASLIMLTGASIALLVGMVLAFVIIRSSNRVLTSIAQSLNSGSTEVVNASHQLSLASQKLAAGASEQAASLEETSASMEEMSSMTKRNAGSAQRANELAKEAREAADKGLEDMQTMATAIDRKSVV